MPDTLKKLRIFAASPSDVSTERAKVEPIAVMLKPLADKTQAEYDNERTEWLNEQKHYRVIRFWNNEVLQNVEHVVSQIADSIHADVKLTKEQK